MAIFAPGTKTIIVGEVAPPGWTKDTTNYNNHALRVTTGSASFGGTRDFDTVFASQAFSGAVSLSGNTSGTALTGGQLPAHTHPGNFILQYRTVFSSTGAPVQYSMNGGPSGFTGGNQVHAHPLSGVSVSVAKTLDLRVKYVDVILVTKD